MHQLPCHKEIDEIRRNLTRLELELMGGEYVDMQRLAIYLEEVQTNVASIQDIIYAQYGTVTGATLDIPKLSP